MEQQESGRVGRFGRPIVSVLMRMVAFFIFGLAIMLVVGYFALENGVKTSRGTRQETITVSLGESEGTLSFAADLRKEGIIGSELPFLYYLFREHLRTKLQAGNYAVSGTMSIPDIVSKIVHGETLETGTKVTFPEGITAADMADRLTAAGLPGTAFLSAVMRPDSALRSRYPFLADIPAGATLEGFLFPDTYFFDPKLGSDAILEKMLDSFGTKATPLLVGVSWKERYDTLVLASIVEMEVRTDADRKIVADIFRRRMDVGMPLQSDATVQYILGVNKVKHSLADISVASPYNTYVNKGLPPGPISNPGLSSIQAVLNPTPNTYLYFLNNPSTGATVFSETFDQHVVNKGKNGL
ncbi:MAG: endolytic transglycosylase MltG [Candidatus Moraniibacteriota bacterium]